jgi:thiazole synthase
MGHPCPAPAAGAPVTGTGGFTAGWVGGDAGGKDGEFLGKLGRSAIGALGTLPVGRPDQHFTIPPAFPALEFVNWHAAEDRSASGNLKYRSELSNQPSPLSSGLMFAADRRLTIAGQEFNSRLILGTGKFSSSEAMRAALEASGTEMVTVSLRRADLSGKKDPFANILEFIDGERYRLLPNTSGAQNAEEAVRLARLAVAAGLPNWIKLEIHPDPHYLLPDPVETLKAAERLVKEGFVVLPYINADPVLAKRLQDAGVATVMPLGSPIGSNRGIQTRDQIRIIIEQATVPVVIDAGLGAPSHAAEAMELGADAVLVNTAIAVAADPDRMAIAFRQAVEAGRAAYEVGTASPQWGASPTSPLTAFLNESPSQ